MTFYGSLLPVLESIASATRAVGELEPKNAQGQRIPASAYLPTYRFLLRQLEGGYDARPDIVAFIAEIRPHWNELKADPAFLAKVDGLDNRNAAVAAAEASGAMLRVPKGFHEFGVRDFLLHPDQQVPGTGRSVAARDLVESIGAVGDPLLAEVCTNSRATLRVIHALRQFDDVCIRYCAARRVEAATQTPLARVLALYREEGNLCVFPSAESLRRGIPSGVLTGGSGAFTDGRIAQVDACVHPTLIHLVLRPNFAHLAWLADDTAPAVQGLDVPGQRDDHVRHLALASGYLAQAIGCDMLAGRTPGYTRNALTFVTSEFRHVSAGYWAFAARGRPGTTEDDAEARWRAMIANLDLRRSARIDAQLGPAAVIVAPVDPVAHIVGLLTEGVMLLRYFDFMRTLMYRDESTATVPGDPRVPLAIAYLRYNQQHNASDSGTAGYVLATLLHVALYRDPTRAPEVARPLRAAMAGLMEFLALERTTIATQVAAVRKSDEERDARLRRQTGLSTDVVSPAAGIHRSEAVAESNEMPNGERFHPVLERWLLDPANAKLLWDYIQAAPEGEWSAWTASRQNATSHRRLHDYYELVFG